MPNAPCGRADDFPWRGPQDKDKCLYILDAGFNVMNTAPYSVAPTVYPGMLQSIADAICDRPADTATQRVARSREVVETVQRLAPRDAVEVMLAGMAVTHAHLIEDAARDVFRGHDERLKARTRSTIVALGRGMFGCLKELRIMQVSARKAAAVAQAEPEAVARAEPEAVVQKAAPPAPGKTLQQASAGVAKPMAGSAPTGTAARATSHVASERLLPPLRRAETSVAAAMAVLSPPMPPYAVSVAGAKPVAAPPAAVALGSAEQPFTAPSKVSVSEATPNTRTVAQRSTPAERVMAA